MSSKDYLQGMPSEIISKFDSQIVQDTPSTRVPTQTITSLHFYADGTNGSDANSGLSSTSPKKTLQAVFDLLPNTIRHNTSIHLKGSFVDVPTFYLDNKITANSFIIDGGSEVEVLAGPYTLDIFNPMVGKSVGSYGNSGVSWTTDQWAGYWVEIFPQAGGDPYMRLISANTATTISPVITGGAALNDTFRIVRPKTTISVSASTFIYFQTEGVGSLRLQRLFFDGANLNITNRCRNPNYFAYTIFNGGFIQCTGGTGLSAPQASYSYNDPDTFTFISTTQRVAGLSMIRPTSYFSIGSGETPQLLSASFFRDVRINSGGILGNFLFYQGVRVKGDGVDPCLSLKGVTGTSALLGNSALGWRPYQIDGGSKGIYMFGCDPVAIDCTGTDMSIDNCSSHAIELDDSRLKITSGVISGSGNTGAGLYAHMGSKFNYVSGHKPTVTGTVGDVSIDGTTQESTWAAIDGGTPIADLNEMTLVRKD